MTKEHMDAIWRKHAVKREVAMLEAEAAHLEAQAAATREFAAALAKEVVAALWDSPETA